LPTLAEPKQQQQQQQQQQMALNNSVRARIEPPSELHLPSPSDLPMAFGNNWQDPAFRGYHGKPQALRNEFAGRSVVAPRAVGSATGAAMRSLNGGSVSLPPIETSSASALRLRAEMQKTMGATDPTMRVMGDRTRALTATGAREFTTSDRYDLQGAVLSFDAAFTERVPESAVERWRTRYVTISYFPEDETFAVNEPVIPNSGLQGGLRLARTKVPLAREDAEFRSPPPIDGSRFKDLSFAPEKFATLLDLNVGRSVNLYATRYYMYACDGFTRDFLSTLGVNVAENETAPEDAFLATRARNASWKYDTAVARAMSRRAAPLREEGRVLRFDGLWHEDVGGAQTRARRFEVRFHLIDGSIGLSERPVPGIVRNELLAKQFLKARRVPKPSERHKAIGGAATIGAEEQGEFYEAEDLHVGATIDVFGRPVFLYDADDLTREYYVQRLGIELAPTQEVNTGTTISGTRGPRALDKVATLQAQSQPYHHTHGASPVSNENIYRFELRIAEPPTDEEALRRFALFVHEDGSMALFEVANKAMGGSGGRVFSKQRIENLTLDDVTVGAVLRLQGKAYRVARTDGATAALLRKRADPTGASAAAVSPSQAAALLKAFRDFLSARYVTLKEAFLALDHDFDGKITVHELRAALSRHHLLQTEAEAVAIIETFDPDGDGRITFDDFISALAPMHTVEIDDWDSSVYKARREAAACQDYNELNGLLEMLRHKMDARHLNGFEMFRMLSTLPRAWPQGVVANFQPRGRAPLNTLTNALKDTVVTPVQFRRGVIESLSMSLRPREMDLILAYFFPELPESEYYLAEDPDTHPARSITLKQFHARMYGQTAAQPLLVSPGQTC
jgi:hypothetical protein